MIFRHLLIPMVCPTPLPSTATLALAALLLAGALQAHAEQVPPTNPAGFNTVECLPGSDTFCGVPLARPHNFQGKIAQVVSGTGETAGKVTLVPQGQPPGWTGGHFANRCFVRMLSGTKAGMYYQVSANNGASVTLDLAGDLAQGFGAGDEFRIHPFWTLATLFPPATQKTVVPSINPAPAGRRTQILIPDLASAGTNLAPAQSFYLLNGVWQAPGGVNADHQILLPDSYFIVRHNHSAITQSTFYRPVGRVELNDIVTPLATRAGGPQDNFVTTGRPVALKLKDLNLVSSGAFVPSVNLAPPGRRDVLLVFNNAAPGVNKAPAITCFHFNSNWYVVDDTGTKLNNDFEILPSHGMIIRKFAQSNGQTAFWKNSLQTAN